MQFGIWTELPGCIAAITRALYGLKSNGAVWRTMFAGTLQDLQYKSSLADPDVWLQPTMKANGEHILMNMPSYMLMTS